MARVVFYIPHFLIGFLLFSLPVSIAGMELFGWLLALGSLVRALWIRVQKRAPLGLCVGPEYMLWGLWGVAALGAAIQQSHGADLVYIIGNFRWVLLLYGYSLALRWEPEFRPKWLVGLVAPVLLIVSLYGLVQVFTGVDLVRPGREIHSLVLANVQIFRAAGFFNNPMTFAHLFALWFCLLLGVILVGGVGDRARLWLRCVALVVAMALVLSLIRGVWISVTVASLVMLGLYNRRIFIRASLGLGLVLAILVVAVPPIRARVVSIFATDNVYNRDRVTLWKANWEIFKDHPLVGIGYTENERRIGEYYQRMGIEKGFHGHAHNVYLQFLAGTGLLGLGCYLGFILYFLLLTYQLWRRIPPDEAWDRSLALGALGAQISLHVGGMTQNNFSDGEVTHNFIFILAIVVALSYKHLSRPLYWRELFARKVGA
ncbi:MAG: O-antigen ligase family protein [Bdellovibrionales bacterium]|nr:O-antigen ligase family protein [Bdellovibrionales bacterium]